MKKFVQASSSSLLVSSIIIVGFEIGDFKYGLLTPPEVKSPSLSESGSSNSYSFRSSFFNISELSSWNRFDFLKTCKDSVMLFVRGALAAFVYSSKNSDLSLATVTLLWF